MRRWPLLLLLAIVVLVGGRFIFNATSKTSDKVQIQQALADAIKASKEGRAGSVVDKLSEQFKVNDATPGMRQVAEFVKKNHPDVTVKDADPLISDDTAQITSNVTVEVDALGQKQSFTFTDAQLLFKKESAMDWLIFPTTKWRLSAVRVSPDQVPQGGQF